MPPKRPTLYKIGILGDGGVGKTATVTQFVFSHFVETYDPTLEDGYRKQCVVDDETCMLELLDTAGQEEYTALRDQWIRNSEGLLIMYSITSRSSFEKCRALYQQVQRLKRELWESQKNQSYGSSNPHEIPDRNVFRDGRFRGIMLAGNKTDVGPQLRVVSTREGKALADELGVDFMECSAKARVNVNEAIYGLVRRIRNEWDEIQFLESGGYRSGAPRRQNGGKETGIERKKSAGGFWKKLVSSKSVKK